MPIRFLVDRLTLYIALSASIRTSFFIQASSGQCIHSRGELGPAVNIRKKQRFSRLSYVAGDPFAGRKPNASDQVFLIIKARNVNQKGGMRDSDASCLPLDDRSRKIPAVDILRLGYYEMNVSLFLSEPQGNRTWPLNMKL